MEILILLANFLRVELCELEHSSDGVEAVKRVDEEEDAGLSRGRLLIGN